MTLRWIEIDGDRFALFEWPIDARKPLANATDSHGPDGEGRVPIEELGDVQARLATLSPAERAVLALVTRGDSNAEIATARRTSVRTVANQVAKLLRKLGATSRFDLIRWFGRA